MPSYAFTLPFGLEDNNAKIILAQRQLIQKRVAGQNVRGTIPEWAGQWGLIGGALEENESAQAACVRTFREQTGLDLSDSTVTANFMLQNQSLINLETASYTPFSVLCVFTTMASLDLLNSILADTVSTIQVSEGTLKQVGIFDINGARQMLGAIPPPPEKWRRYLIQNYYGGKPPGQLNTEIDILTTRLTRSAAQDNSFFATALSDTTAA